MFDFSLSPELVALRNRTASFIRDEVIPLEHLIGEHQGPPVEALNDLRAKARTAGLYAPHVAKEWGGLGLDMREMAVIFEEAGQSLLGPLALNCAAPDEGNMHLLEIVATPEQQERYLRPLVEGSVRSCFAMTEPPPGAGADPSMLRTRAERRGSQWVINGKKWYITGADGASFAICMARMDDEADNAGGARATMFLVDTDNPGFRVVRQIPSLDAGFLGGHCEVAFEECVVGEEAVLGKVGEGFRYAQVRLAPARLTHCMRWLGAAQRSQNIAAAYATIREGGGKALADHQMTQAMLADSAMDLHAARLMIWQAAWTLDLGEAGRYETSLAKTYVAEAVNRVIDRAMQICGSHGVSANLPLALFYRNARPFRIYDGPSEVHRMVIARQTLRTAVESGARDLLATFPPEVQVGSFLHPKSGPPAAVPSSQSTKTSEQDKHGAAGLTPLIDAPALRTYLARALPGTDSDLVVERIRGGHSNETFFVTRGEEEFVLRRPPRGPLLPTAHDVGREHHMLSALAPTDVPTPQPLLYCEDVSIIGVPFFLMERVRGMTIRETLPPGFAHAPETRRGLGEALVDALAHLHAVDWRAVGLETFGKPNGYLERQIRRWQGQLDASRTRAIPELDAVTGWLQDHLPASGPATIVHGDYRMDNVIFAARPPARLLAIVDWEMATLGDPLADLGYLLSFWREPTDQDPPVGDPGWHVTAQPGFLTRAQMAQRYAERTGRPVDHIAFYITLAIWKLAILLEGSYKRSLAGTTDDPFFATLGEGVPALAHRALAVAQGELALV